MTSKLDSPITNRPTSSMPGVPTHRARGSVRAADRRSVALDVGEMAGAAMTRPGAAKARWKPPRPPRQPRDQRPESAAAIDEITLLDRLRDHALGVADMTSTQVRAVEIVMKRAKAADEPENHAVKTISAEPMSEEEWLQKYAR
jgi:hypothetical protein